MKRVKSKLERVPASEAPRFLRASVQVRQLHRLIALVGVGAVALLVGAWGCARTGLDPIWQPVLLDNGAMLLLLAAGLYSALQVSRSRRNSLIEHAEISDSRTADTRTQPEWEVRVRRILDRFTHRLGSMLRAQELLLGLIGILALWMVRCGWNLAIAGSALNRAGYLGAGVALAAAFGVLVLERYLNGRTMEEWPEAARLAYLARAAILTLLLAAVSIIFDADTRLWPPRLAVLSGIIPAALTFELLLRAIFAAITGAPAGPEPRLLADSSLAGLLTWPPRPFRAIEEELRGRFGIDLRQNWAFGFIKRVSLPVLGAVALIGWLLTGTEELSMASRGIYERFGKPVEVWDPGLHWGLPWPLARTRRVENGVVHELATSVSSDTQSEPDQSSADAPAPASANRLWDVSHVAENAQVISSEADTKQSFQVVNMDVRFIYRIGLTPEAAMSATYHCSDVDALLRSTASRVMVHYFASRTLDGLLGEQRDVIARDIEQAVQEDLNSFDSGVELLSVLVESIHPPAGAAAAYHSVQAAQISAQAIVARERGLAALTINEAQQSARTMESQAAAAARENTADAEIAKLGFDAEQQSFHEAGQAFVRERYFSQLAQGLGKANLIIIDHRIGSAGSAPTLDLRNFGAPYSYR